MTSSRFILIFLGFIFLIIVLLAGNRIAAGLRAQFGKFLPSTKQTQITPTPTIGELSPTPTLTSSGQGSTSSSEIPATGPENLVWLILGGSLLSGITLKKITATSER